jgi:peptidoglycan/LPS O-acetylase OafA/YrhL
MRGETRQRLECLDGVRGVAALVVVVFHYLSAFLPTLTPDQTSNPCWLADTPLAILFNGPFAVVVFFVLSGFVISRSAVKRFHLSLTIASRYLRLTVPMVASVIIAWLLLISFPNDAATLGAITGTPWLAKTYNGEIPSLFSAVKDGTFEVYLHGMSHFNNALWSMRPELKSVLASRFFQVGPCLFLGRISFGLYLIHVPVAYTLVMVVAIALWPMSPFVLGLGLLVFTAVSISLGWLMTLVVDVPTQRVLQAIRKASRRDSSHLKARADLEGA